MSTEQNMATQKKMGEVINKGNLDQLNEVFSANVKDHDPAPDQGSGPEGFVHFFTGLRAAFPDLEIAVEHTVSNENNIALAYVLTGTHHGIFQGIPPTGKKVKARGMQIARFENGKIVERWGSSDELGILQQIGAAPAAGKTTQPLTARKA